MGFVVLVVTYLFVIVSTCTEQHKDEPKIEIITEPPKNCLKGRSGDFLMANYNLSFVNGTLLMSTYPCSSEEGTCPLFYNDPPQPVTFLLGTSEKPGYNRALRAICKGERRRATLPGRLMYGTQTTNLFGLLFIPGNSTMIYEVDVLDHVPKAEMYILNEFRSADESMDWLVNAEEIEMVIKRNAELRRALRFTIGTKAVANSVVQTWDKNGDRQLDREEYFEFYKHGKKIAELSTTIYNFDKLKTVSRKTKSKVTLTESTESSRDHGLKKTTQTYSESVGETKSSPGKTIHEEL